MRSANCIIVYSVTQLCSFPDDYIFAAYSWVPVLLQVLDPWVQVPVHRYSHRSESGQNNQGDSQVQIQVICGSTCAHPYPQQSLMSLRPRISSSSQRSPFFSRARIRQVIHSLSPYKVPGPDKIPNIVLMKCCVTLLLTTSFTYLEPSLSSTSTIPDGWNPLHWYSAKSAEPVMT